MTHRYLSTACLHDECGYCQASTRPDGTPKLSASCKFCGAKCICACHEKKTEPNRFPDPGCYIHGVEPIPEKFFRLCTECGHCYITREDLLYEDAKVHRQLGIAVPDPDAEIHICPLCTHDF